MKLNNPCIKFLCSLIFLLFIFTGCYRDKSAEDFSLIPDPKTINESYVSNPDQILSSATVASLNTKLSDLDQSGRAHIDVVVVESIGEAVPKDAATALFRKWKIGDQKTNNGLLILVVKDQHRIEFETGYGLEGDLPDLVCYRIQQKYMIPHARNNDFDLAVQDGVNGIIKELNPVVTDGKTIPAIVGDVPVKPSIDDTARAQQPRVDENGIAYKTDEVIADPPETFKQEEGRSSNYGPINIDPGTAEPVVENSAELNQSSSSKLHTTGNEATFFIFIIYLALMIILDKRFNGEKRKYRLLSPLFWLTFILPFALVLYLNWFHYTSHFNIRTCIIFYSVTTLYTNFYFYFLSRRFNAGIKDKSRHEQYMSMVKQQRNLTLSAYLCPLPWLFFYYRKFVAQIDHLRNDPYHCKTCGNVMFKLLESDEDKFLDRGQISEEKLYSVDYDVWVCSGNKDHEKLVLDYKNLRSTAAKCPQCKYYTFVYSRQKVKQRATTSSGGWGWQYQTCQTCNHEEQVKFMIPKISSSSGGGSSSGASSSSSSSSSSSRSSSSGGSSGGGGAGSSW